MLMYSYTPIAVLATSYDYEMKMRAMYLMPFAQDTANLCLKHKKPEPFPLIISAHFPSLKV